MFLTGLHMMEDQEKHSLLYRDISLAGGHMMQSFDPQHELFGPQAGIEMLGIPSTSKAQNPNPNPWQVDDSSLLYQTSRGFSLSLSRDWLFSEAPNPHQHQLFSEDGRFFQLQQLNQVKRSKYLTPAQELLNEFCNLGTESSTKGKQKKSREWEEEGPSSSSQNQSLSSMDLVQMQKRKANLLSMLEEVDRRYRKYCEQMRAVVSSFEAVAGQGAATVYSSMASKAMSRHFRALRDGIMGQLTATKRAMGDKDTVALGTTRGETPRLKVFVQCLGQQKAFHQGGMSEGHPWRPQRGLPDRAVSVLRAWLFEHFLHPYPSDVDKHILARQTGLSRSQVSNWFINARVRLWKPMVEEMYVEELKDQDNPSSGHHQGSNNPNPNPNSDPLGAEEQKPTLGQLATESDSLASIINSARYRDQQGSRGESFGAVDLDFSNYSSFDSRRFGNSVSLTLGLQQHEGGGMTLPLSPASQHNLLFSTEQMDEGQPVGFSILDGEAENLPYRNLMAAQLLHDLAG